MYCPRCGKDLETTAKFCPNCGFNLEVRKEINEKTREIDLETIKEVERNTRYNFIKKKEPNQNGLIISLCSVVVLVLLIVLVVANNSKRTYLNIDPKESFCKQNVSDPLCKVEETKEEITSFDSMNFNKYDFSVSSSKQDFQDNVVSILNQKYEEGNAYCNDRKYTEANEKINRTLNSDYSYLCGMDITYLDNLIIRLNAFYKNNNIDDKIVDAYVVGKGGRNEYANYTSQTIGASQNYVAYLRRVHISVNMFEDYDKLKKTYERDLQTGYHPANSTPEDIIVHETAHALDFYISAQRYGIEELVIDDFSKYTELYNSWGNQTYAKEVVQKAVKQVNADLKANNLPEKTEEELRREISGYAASSKNGTIMYAETFAEALVDYLSNDNNASSLSIEIYKIVQEDLKNI